MTTKTSDKTRLLVTIIGIIGIAAAMGVVPSLWAAL
jgi:hypothetical protein